MASVGRASSSPPKAIVWLVAECLDLLSVYDHPRRLFLTEGFAMESSRRARDAGPSLSSHQSWLLSCNTALAREQAGAADLPPVLRHAKSGPKKNPRSLHGQPERRRRWPLSSSYCPSMEVHIRTKMMVHSSNQGHLCSSRLQVRGSRLHVEETDVDIDAAHVLLPCCSLWSQKARNKSQQFLGVMSLAAIQSALNCFLKMKDDGKAVLFQLKLNRIEIGITRTWG